MTAAPIFLLSLPRSGSTLLQRMIGAHPDVSTVSEPWILLPLMNQFISEGTYAFYDHRVATAAIREFALQLPGGQEELYEEIRYFISRLYKSAGGSTRYFLDKTPRYSLFTNQLLRVFPDARYIVLFRNPLAVLASIMLRWGHANRFRHDLHRGLRSLVHLKSHLGSACVVVRYEDLVVDAERELQRVCNYLDMAYSAEMLEGFRRVELVGRFGDHARESEIRLEPLERWRSILRENPLRYVLAKRYLTWIGQQDLATMGYSFSDTLDQLGQPRVSSRHLVSDMFSWMRGLGASLLERRILAPRIQNSATDASAPWNDNSRVPPLRN